MEIKQPLIDRYGRTIHYLRLSVTDRCNLRCSYCARHLGLTFIPHADILSYEEMLCLLKALVERGVDKLRLTGGEPFVRKDFMSFVRRVRATYPELRISITTNATLLAPHVFELKKLNIEALNISFDTFREKTFQTITGSTLFSKAVQGLQAALGAGLNIKINVVGLKGVNSGELKDFIALAKENPVDVRFIEFMPLGGRRQWTEAFFWSAQDIYAAAQNYAVLQPVDSEQDLCSASPERTDNTVGPAKMYSIEGGVGRFGLITPVSCHFCYACNRLRVTSDGRFRTCLFSDDELVFRDILREGKDGIIRVMALLEGAVLRKPLGFQLLHDRSSIDSVMDRSMQSIGG